MDQHGADDRKAHKEEYRRAVELSIREKFPMAPVAPLNTRIKYSPKAKVFGIFLIFSILDTPRLNVVMTRMATTVWLFASTKEGESSPCGKYKNRKAQSSHKGG